MFEKLRKLISALFTFGVLLLLLFTNSAWEPSGVLISGLLFLTGLVLIGIASIGRLWCSLYIAGYKDKALITVGPYSISRNPLYFFSLIGAVGVGMVSETFLIPTMILLGFAIYYPMVIKSEEIRLERKHPKKFNEYKKNVPRFFPRISKLVEPEEYIVKPIVFRKHALDALWFVWFVGILKAIEALHEARILPIFFRLY